MPRPQPRLVIPPREKAERKAQSILDRETLFMQVFHDCRDLQLAVDVLAARPELLTRPHLTRAIGVQVDGFLSRLQALRQLLHPRG